MARTQLLCKWYDMWVGAFWDRSAHWLYILPIPCCGLVLKFLPDRMGVVPMYYGKEGLPLDSTFKCWKVYDRKTQKYVLDHSDTYATEAKAYQIAWTYYRIASEQDRNRNKAKQRERV
jgi:hypothetical protein